MYADEYHVKEHLKGARVLDIGAHAGYFAEFCFDNGAREVVAVEPHPANFELLRDNCVKAIILPWAINNQERILRMDSAWPTWGTLINTGGQKAGKDGDILVSCVALDKLMEVYGPFDVMKIDCEGAEWDFMIPFPYEIPVIVGEFHEIDGHTFKELEEALHKHEVVELFRYSNVPIGLFKAVKNGNKE